MRPRRGITAAVTVLALATLAVTAPPSEAATTKFTSCAKMLRVYPKGIAKDKKAADRAVKNGQYRPKVAPQVYRDSYKSLDRDKDGSMCEQDVN
jgi:hypothetical protein